MSGRMPVWSRLVVLPASLAIMFQALETTYPKNQYIFLTGHAKTSKVALGIKSDTLRIWQSTSTFSFNHEDWLYLKSTNALSIGYMKIMKVVLTITASWPYDMAGGKIHPAYWFYRRCAVAWGLLAISGEICFLIDNCKILSFYELGHIYLTCFYAFLGWVRTFLPLFSRHGKIIERFLFSFHLIHFKHKGNYYHKMYENIEWLSHRVVIIAILLALFCAGAFSVMPIINNIISGAYSDRNKPIEFSIFFSYPGFDPQDHYKFVTGWNFFLVYACLLLVVGIDIIITLFVFQIIGHIEILNNTMKVFPKPKDAAIVKISERVKKPVILTANMFTAEENFIIKDKIKQCVEHHLLINSFTDDMSEFFGPVIAFYYLFHQVAGCIMLLEMSAGDLASLTRYGPLTVVSFGQLILVSTIFEIVNTKSEQLVETAYCLPWESMNLSNQRSVCLLVHRLQTPISVTALGVTPVNVRTMLAIMKTSFSYFAFLKTLKD